MSPKKLELTAQEMEAELLIFNGESLPDVADKLGMNYRTLQRARLRPQFVSYREELRKREAAKQRTARPKVVFTIDDAAAGYLEVRNDPEVTHANKIRALDSLVELYRLKESTAAPQDGEVKPDEPDIYKPAWMQ